MSPTPHIHQGGRHRFAYLFPIALLVVVYWLCAAVYLFVDPYGIYPWGRATAVEGRFDPENTPYLVDAVLGDPRYDLLIVGGSTLVRMDPRDVETAVGGRAFNLSYSGPRPRDRKVIFDRILSHTHLRHVIVSLDWSSLLDSRRGGDAFPFYLYNNTPYDDLRGLSRRSLLLAADRVTVGTISAEPGEYPQYVSGDVSRRRDYLAHGNLVALAAAIEHKRRRIGSGVVRPCGQLGAIAELQGFAAAAAGRGVKVTVLIPPVSLAWFYEWVDNEERRISMGGDPLAATLGMWRCAVYALSAIPGANVVGFDDLDWIGGDLRNYIDAGHIVDPRIYAFIAKSLEDPGRRLDSASIDGYVRLVDARVRRFVVDPDMASEIPGR
jgi:hypothetical protein